MELDGLKPIIFDVDTGIDDALAMAYALNSPELEVLGFTTCFGNIPVENATRNTLTVLEMVGNPTISVYEGAAETMVRGEKKKYPTWVHGEDGLGNLEKNNPIGQAECKSGPDFIIEEVKNRPYEITIIAVGPLTNIALAIQKAPEIVPLVKEIIVMGGAVKVPGNATPFGEANIVSDPEAANIVFSSGLKVVLVGLDVTMQTLLPKSRMNAWIENGGDQGRFFADMTDFYIECYETNNPGIGGCALHDPLAVGVAIDSSFVKTEKMNIKVVTEGEEVGKTIGYDGEEPNVYVCTEVEADRFLEHFVNRVV